MQEQKWRADSEISGLSKQLILTKFCLDRFKHNEIHFKFYTRLETFEKFNHFIHFFSLEPMLLFIGAL